MFKMSGFAMKAAAVLMAAGLMASMAGCSSTVETTAYKTVNGQTEGTAKKSTNDKGSAGFTVKGNHVTMTNFEFDADPDLKVQAELEEDPLVFTRVVVHDGENTIQNIADGHYTAAFTQENAAKSMNDIYQKVLGASDEPFADDDISLQESVLTTGAELSDGQLIILAKDGSDEYVVIAATTAEYGTQEIVDAAFDALAGGTSGTAESSQS